MYDALDAFSSCTGIPVTIYDETWRITKEFLPEKKICKLLPHYKEGGKCRKYLEFSISVSFDLGEPYIFTCSSGLVLIAVPLLRNNQREGAVLAGPVVLGDVNESLITQIMELNENDPSLLTRVAFFLRELKEYGPDQVQKMGTLLYGAVLSHHRNWQEYEDVQTRQRSQYYGSDAIRQYKEELEKQEQEAGCPTPRALLVRQLQNRNKAESDKLMHSILEEIILVEGGNFDIIKMRLFELFVYLCQEAMGVGVSLQKIFGVGFDPIEGLNNARTVDDLEDWTKQILHHFSSQVFTAVRHGLSEIITQAIAFIEENYAQKLTLRELSQHLHINESYLSKLFKKELDVNFTDYLNDLRIRKSLQLMDETNMSILEIAIQVGFDDQSYYTKIFKKVTGKTPRQYKNAQATDRFKERIISASSNSTYLQGLYTGGKKE